MMLIEETCTDVPTKADGNGTMRKLTLALRVVCCTTKVVHKAYTSSIPVFQIILMRGFQEL